MSVAISNLATTWTNSGTTYTGIKLNVTDTASAAASLLMDLQVGGSSRFSVKKNADVDSPGAMLVLNDIRNFSVSVDRSSTSHFTVRNGYAGSLTGAVISSTFYFGWSSSSNSNTSAAGVDVRLYRDDAAQTLAQRNGTNAQVFRVYNTFTDASNYERGFVRYASNVFEIGNEAAGTGSTAREVKLVSSSAIKAGTAANLADIFYATTANFGFAQSVGITWSSSSTNAGTGMDTGLARTAAGVVRVTNGTTGGGALQMTEMTAPAAPAANNVRIYAEDDGAGKTRLMALFATGAAVQLAIEP